MAGRSLLGFVVRYIYIMSFATPYPAAIRIWGEEVIHSSPAGGERTVRVIRADPDTALAQGALLVLFGTIADSGFEEPPARGDTVFMDGLNYKVYDVKSDWCGGTQRTAGFWLHLNQEEV